MGDPPPHAIDLSTVDLSSSPVPPQWIVVVGVSAELSLRVGDSQFEAYLIHGTTELTSKPRSGAVLPGSLSTVPLQSPSAPTRSHQIQFHAAAPYPGNWGGVTHDYAIQSASRLECLRASS